MHACVIHFLQAYAVQDPNSGNGAAQSGLGLLTSINITRDVWLLFSKGILGCVKLTIKAKHHSDVTEAICKLNFCVLSEVLVVLLEWLMAPDIRVHFTETSCPFLL